MVYALCGREFKVYQDFPEHIFSKMLITDLASADHFVTSNFGHASLKSLPNGASGELRASISISLFF